MDEVKISALPTLETPASDDTIPIVDESDGATKKIAVGNLTGTPEFGWVSTVETWTYASWSATTRIGVLTVPSDATQTYSPGMRVRFAQSTGGTKYGIIHAVSSTTLTVFFPDGTTLNNEAINVPAISASKVPFGFDADPVKWQIVTEDTTALGQSSPTGGTWYNIGSLSITLGPGAWHWEYMASTRTNDSGGSGTLFSTLSTANNSESDKDNTASSQLLVADNTGTIRIGDTMYRNGGMLLSAQDQFFLNFMTSTAGLGNILVDGDVSTTIIRATSAYL